MIENIIHTVPCCKNCKFHHEDENNNNGSCHKKPPQCFSDGVGRWPTVEPEDWCGEFVTSRAAIRAALKG
jgi:hypothetical protein